MGVHRSTWAIACGVVLGSSGAARAQDVVPASLAAIEGGSASSIPFGISGPVRYQMLFDADQLPFSGPRLIREIRIRADWNDGAAIPAKQFLRVDVDLSTTAVSADSASSTFDQNHGIDRMRVATFLQLALPAQPDTGGAPGPRPAAIVIPFNRDFWYGFTPGTAGPPPRNLCIDLQISSQPSGVYRIDSPFTCDSQVQSFGQLDDPCRPSHSTDADPLFLEIDSSSDIRAGGLVRWTIRNLAPNAPYWIAVASTPNGNWLGTPLPAPLHADAPGCFVNVRLGGILLTGSADAQSVAEKVVNLPSNRNLVGQTFYAQAWTLDIAANPFGYVNSLGVQSTVCGPLGCARVYRLGNANADTGSVTFGAAPVIELY